MLNVDALGFDVADLMVVKRIWLMDVAICLANNRYLLRPGIKNENLASATFSDRERESTLRQYERIFLPNPFQKFLHPINYQTEVVRFQGRVLLTSPIYFSILIWNVCVIQIRMMNR